MYTLQLSSTTSEGLHAPQGTPALNLDQTSLMNSLSNEEHASTGRKQVKVAVLATQAALRFVHGLQPPQAHLWFEDPITCETMCDPVKCNDGRTYNRWTVIGNGMTKSPFTRRPFSIAVDDVNVRSWLFSTFPEQELKFLSKRTEYRAKALQHLRYCPLEVQVAIEMLNNVLQWAPEDTECRNELNVILSNISRQSGQSNSLPQGSDSEARDVNHAIMEGDLSERSQTYVMPVISHEDLIRERYGEGRIATLFWLIFSMGVYFILFEFQRAS